MSSVTGWVWGSSLTFWTSPSSAISLKNSVKVKWCCGHALADVLGVGLLVLLGGGGAGLALSGGSMLWGAVWKWVRIEGGHGMNWTVQRGDNRWWKLMWRLLAVDP